MDYINHLAERLGLSRIEPGQDVHRLKASKMFNVSYSEVTPEQRQAAKQANYFKLYSEPTPPFTRKQHEL